MKTEEELKNIVKEKYSEIAHQDKGLNASSCCGATTPSTKIYNIMMDDYTQVDGYNEDADLGLGCGLPTQFAKINKGDTVIDLGSGAGNDCFVARHETGDSGKVIGIDFTEAMITKARINADKMRYNNVEFRFGDIDNMPVADNTADVIVSNCVLNLVPNKEKVIKEIHRTLKPGGHFSISDIVLVGALPKGLREDAEMYAGCVAEKKKKEEYLGYIESLGFENITVQKEKVISIPDDILSKYLTEDELSRVHEKSIGIFSITVFASKPGVKDEKSLSEQNIVVEEVACCSSSTSCC